MKQKTNKVGKVQPRDPGVNILSPFAYVYNWKYFSLAFSILFTAVMLYIALAFHKVGGFDVETDFYSGYAPEAKAFMLGKIVIDSYHGPLYPWLLGLIAGFVGDLFKTGVVISVLSAALSLYFVFEIIKSIFSTDIAFLSTLLTAANAIFIRYSYSAGTDMFFVALSLAGIFLLFRKSEISVIELCLSSFFLALAYLVRYNGLIFLIAMPLVLLFKAVQVKGQNKYLAAAIWVSVFLVVIAPWAIYLKINRGSFFYNADYQNMAFELFGGGYGNWDEFWYKLAGRYTSYWDVLTADPFLLVKTLLNNVYSHFVDDITRLNNAFTGLTSVIGIVIFAFSHPARRKIGLIAIFFSFYCVLLTVFYTERFSLLLLPMYSFFASYLIKKVIEKFGLKKVAVGVINLLVVIALVLTFSDSYTFNSTFVINNDADDMVRMSEWFHQKFDDQFKNEQIAARKPHIAYFLNMRLYPFPMVRSYDSLITILKRDSVRFLYYGLFEARDRPQFFGLLGGDTLHPGLKLLGRVGDRIPSCPFYMK